MKIVIETFVSIFFITAIIFVATQLLGAQIQVNAAEEFQNNVVKKIEESNFDAAVVAECIEQANAQEYLLVVDVNKKNVLSCNSCNYQWDIEDSTICDLCGANNASVLHLYHDGCVSLTYHVSSALLGVDQVGTIVSYAR